MKIVHGFADIDLKKFSEYVMSCVNECRRTVGYQKDPDWECPFLKHGDNATLRAQYPGKYVGSFNCYPCLAKETKDWQEQGLPIPASREWTEDGETRPIKY